MFLTYLLTIVDSHIKIYFPLPFADLHNLIILARVMNETNKTLEALLKEDTNRLRSFYLEEREKLFLEVQRLTGEIRRIDGILGYIDGNVSSSSTINDKYNSSWYWWQKAKFVLEQKNKPCTIREILEQTYQLEDKPFDFSNEIVKSDYSAIYSDVSKKAIKNEVFWRARNENLKQFEYGLTEWNKIGGIA